jgi:hypothetical protein
VFRRLKTTKIYCSIHKSVVEEAYRQELQVVLKNTLLATLVSPVGTLSSGITSDNTCIQIGLDLLKPSIDKLIDCLTAIVPPRKTLGKILSSTYVIG